METVAEILGDATGEAAVERIEPPRHPHQPAFPQPGIYFGMPEDVYHSIHACSASGLKKLSVSSMDYWAHSVLNLDRDEDKVVENGQLTGKGLGRAYHTRICEGPAAFARAYYVTLDKDLVRLEAEAAKKPICETIADIRAAIDEAGAKPKGTAKEALIDQLLDLDPQAFVWDRLVAAHNAAHAGKTPISPKLYRRIEIAAAMINGDPQLKDAFNGGHAEVSLFWYDEATGIPCKARLDYLKLTAWVDLKSFANKQGKPVQRAIDMAISHEKYFIPVVFYGQAIAAVKKLVKANGAAAVFTPDGKGGWEHGHDQAQWAWKWAHQPEPEALFVFQQTGVAPVTRGRIMPPGTTFTVTEFAVSSLKRRWRICAETFGTDPWIDIEPVTRTEDESLTFAATDFGEVR